MDDNAKCAGQTNGRMDERERAKKKNEEDKKIAK